jgi:hypothetical protein
VRPSAAETVSDRIAAELRAQVTYRGYSGASVARGLNVDPLWVTRRLSGTIPLTVEDLFTICTVIGAVPLDLVAEVMVKSGQGPAGLAPPIYCQPTVVTREGES